MDLNRKRKYLRNCGEIIKEKKIIYIKKKAVETDVAVNGAFFKRLYEHIVKVFKTIIQQYKNFYLSNFLYDT